MTAEGWRSGEANNVVEWLASMASEGRFVQGRRPLKRAVGALPRTSPGGKPPETPGPLSLEFRWYGEPEICQGFATPARTPPLTNLRLSEQLAMKRERGP